MNSEPKDIKACMFMKRRFAYAGHAMAVVLQKKYGVKDFCGYTSLRSSLNFLQSQKDIHYSELALDEDVHKLYRKEKLDPEYLKFLEKEYGIPNLWPYIEIDRIIRHGQFLREYPHDAPFYSHEDMLRILQARARFLIDFVERQKPDFILFAVITGMSSLLLYHIAKKKNIKTFFIQTSRIGTKQTLTEDYNKLSYVEKTSNNMREGASGFQTKHLAEAKNFLNNFREKPAPHSIIDTVKFKPVDRRRQFEFLKPRNLIRSSSWALKVALDYIKDQNKDDHTTVKPWHYILDRVKRKTRVLVGFDDLYDEADFKENFAFFPLHLEPEMSISLFAPFYTDQLWLAKQIARSLPAGFKLYVKEHPAMFGYRPRSFYRELKKIPCVRLIRPSQESFPLIKNAKLVITMNSTAGWEAILFKKPVIAFGNVFYNALPMVKKCVAIEDLPHMVKEQLEKFHYDENALIRLIAAIFQESADADLVQIWDIEGGSNMEKKEREVVQLVDLLASKLGLKTV